MPAEAGEDATPLPSALLDAGGQWHIIDEHRDQQFFEHALLSDDRFAQFLAEAAIPIVQLFDGG